MRVWDLHPGYLSRQNLLGQHAEIHALFSIIDGEKKGYSLHPETLRWKGKLGMLKRIHDLSVLEMKLRGFNHASPIPDCRDLEPGAKSYVDHPLIQIEILSQKYRQRNQAGRIPLPKNIDQFWAHHKYSIMARGYVHYRGVQGTLRDIRSSAFKEAGFLTGQILDLMELPVTTPALANVVDHLWGYLKEESSDNEKKRYMSRQADDLPELIGMFFDLARRYNRPYLLHSTIFADFTNQHHPEI